MIDEKLFLPMKNRVEYLNNANFIKSIVIDFIFKKNTEILLGSEVKFGTQENFADIILLKNKKIFGYEIKASNDDFRTVKKQLKNYSKVFDYCYLVVTEKHLKHALREIRDETGLLIISNDGNLTKRKTAKLIQNNLKEEILASMTKDYIVKYFNEAKYLSVKEARGVLKNKTLPDLKRFYYSYLENRLKPVNKIFKKERGIITHFEDIAVLSFNINTEIL